MKSWWKSKLNWLGALLIAFSQSPTILDMIVSPEFNAHLKELLSPETFRNVTSLFGIAVMVLRTCCTSTVIGKGK